MTESTAIDVWSMGKGCGFLELDLTGIYHINKIVNDESGEEWGVLRAQKDVR